MSRIRRLVGVIVLLTSVAMVSAPAQCGDPININRTASVETYAHLLGVPGACTDSDSAMNSAPTTPLELSASIDPRSIPCSWEQTLTCHWGTCLLNYLLGSAGATSSAEELSMLGGQLAALHGNADSSTQARCVEAFYGCCAEKFLCQTDCNSDGIVDGPWFAEHLSDSSASESATYPAGPTDYLGFFVSGGILEVSTSSGVESDDFPFPPPLGFDQVLASASVTVPGLGAFTLDTTEVQDAGKLDLPTWSGILPPNGTLTISGEAFATIGPDVFECAEELIINGEADDFHFVQAHASYCVDVVLYRIARNVEQVTGHDTWLDAVSNADAFDVLSGLTTAFSVDPVLDFDRKPLTVELSLGPEPEPLPPGGQILFADNSVLSIPSPGPYEFHGDLLVPTGANALLEAGTETRITCESPQFQSNCISPPGSLTLNPLSSLIVGTPLTNGGTIAMYGGALDVAGTLTNAVAGVQCETGTITGFGTIVGDVVNGLQFDLCDNQVILFDDMQIIGDYTNRDTTIVQNGTLAVLGTLTNTGTIIGDVFPAAGGTEGSGDPGLAVIGDLVLGPDAGLALPSPGSVVAVSGDFDAAIDDNENYDMAQAELRMIGLGDVPQQLEVMSVDIGDDLAGLDPTLPGHFPIGTLRIGPTPTEVDLVDNQFNYGGPQAVYVNHLIIESGATLNTNGHKVYYATAQIDGDVDLPFLLIQLTPPPPCPWDCGNEDGVVGIVDLLTLLAQWGGTGACDFDGGVVGITDLLELLAHWAPCS